MSSELVKHVTDDSFGTDVLQADKPVLVDYWAERSESTRLNSSHVD